MPCIARQLLEDVAGCPVLVTGRLDFRLRPMFPWFFDTLLDAGYSYDSSVFPAARGHGGMESSGRAPHYVSRNGIYEFPITVTDLFGRTMCFFGGGYLRLFPYSADPAHVVIRCSRKAGR
jgi:hypothetical protein